MKICQKLSNIDLMVKFNGLYKNKIIWYDAKYRHWTQACVSINYQNEPKSKVSKQKRLLKANELLNF